MEQVPCLPVVGLVDGAKYVGEACFVFDPASIMDKTTNLLAYNLY